MKMKDRRDPDFIENFDEPLNCSQCVKMKNADAELDWHSLLDAKVTGQRHFYPFPGPSIASSRSSCFLHWISRVGNRGSVMIRPDAQYS